MCLDNSAIPAYPQPNNFICHPTNNWPNEHTMWQACEWDKIINFTESSCKTVTMKAQGLL